MCHNNHVCTTPNNFEKNWNVDYNHKGQNRIKLLHLLTSLIFYIFIDWRSKKLH